MLGRRSLVHAPKSTPKQRPNFLTPQRNSPRGTRKTRLAVEGSHHIVETFGGPLPVLVTETLSRLEKDATASVVVDPNGWVWLVAGKKLLVWRYRTQAMGKPGSCRELPLPTSSASQLAFEARLVCVMEDSSQPDVSCIASTPDGCVRYWPNICQEAIYVDTSIELRGQVARNLHSLQNGLAILAASQSALFLLSPAQTVVRWQELKPSTTGSGMLSGFSRRMSSFIFGSNQSLGTIAPLHQILTNEQGDLMVLSGSQLQKWTTQPDSRMLYQCNLEALLVPKIIESMHARDVTVTPLDMQWTRSGVIILAAAVDSATPQVANFVTATVSTVGDEPPDTCLQFGLLKYSSELQDGEYPPHRLIPSDPNSQFVYLLADSTVICVPMADPVSQPTDKLQFLSTERILGICNSGGSTPLLYCHHLGLVCIKPVKFELNLSLLDTSSSIMDVTAARMGSSRLNDQSMQDEGAPTGSHVDEAQQMKAAFLLWLREGQPAGIFTLEQVNISLNDDDGGGTLYESVVELSRRLLDDVSLNDPRWAEAPAHGNDMMSAQQQQIVSVLLVNQLEEKHKAHYLYRLFLNSTGIWNKFVNSLRGHRAIAVVCEHADKIAAARALLDASSRNAVLVDSAIRIAVGRRGHDIPRNLTPQDVFYREVSRVDDIFDALQAYQDTQLNAAASAAKLIMDVNEIFLALVMSIAKHAAAATAAKTYMQDKQVMPWTGAYGQRGLRTLLEKQHTVTLTHAVPAAEDGQVRGTIYQQLAELADAILNAFVEMLAVKDGSVELAEADKRYIDVRDRLLRPFLAFFQYERAASLAEKYCHYQLLIEICELTHDDKRLQRYQERFAHQGFSDILFRYYMREGKQAKLLTSTLLAKQQPARDAGISGDVLEDFLHREGYVDLSWLHNIGQNRFYEAYEGLQHLAEKEATFLGKKKTLCSLGKLALLASDDGLDDTALASALRRIDFELDIILHQEQLPADAIRDLGMDAQDMRVMTPSEIVEAYVGEHNVAASELDFLKALDLLRLFAERSGDSNDEELKALQLHVWSRAVLRDDWLALSSVASASDLLSTLSNTIFLRLVDLILIRGDSSSAAVNELLPSMQSLLNSAELAELKSETKFRYLLAAAYEHVSTALAIPKAFS